VVHLSPLVVPPLVTRMPVELGETKWQPLCLLCNLKSQPNNLLNMVIREGLSVLKTVIHQSTQIDVFGSLEWNSSKQWQCESFAQYIFKGLVKLYATLMRYIWTCYWSKFDPSQGVQKFVAAWLNPTKKICLQLRVLPYLDSSIILFVFYLFLIYVLNISF
jgi:hypothetical protein